MTAEGEPLSTPRKQLLFAVLERAGRALRQGPAKKAAVDRAAAHVRDTLEALELPTKTDLPLLLATLTGANFITENIVQAMARDPDIPLHIRAGIGQNLDALMASVAAGVGVEMGDGPATRLE